MLEKIIGLAGIPKQVVDSAQKFAISLLGQSTREVGETIHDQIRYIRFQNQVKILNKAERLLHQTGKNPAKINLKVLAPLIEYSSLEEDENMQECWASMIASISTNPNDQSFDLKCVETLKELSNPEVKLLDLMFQKFKIDEIETLKKWKTDIYWVFNKHRDSVYGDNTLFDPRVTAKEFLLTEGLLSMYFERLVSLGILNREQPALKENTEKQEIISDLTGTRQHIDTNTYEIDYSDRVHFTEFGLYFVNIVKSK